MHEANYTKQLITQISQVFKDQKNPNNINISALREYADKDPSLRQAIIFKKKLAELGPISTISRKDFENKFIPDCTKREHFDLIFDLVDKDGSGKISKRELQLLNKQYNLNFTKSDIDLMINFASKDGQKVFKQDLFKFINA